MSSGLCAGTGNSQEFSFYICQASDTFGKNKTNEQTHTSFYSFKNWISENWKIGEAGQLVS